MSNRLDNAHRRPFAITAFGLLFFSLPIFNYVTHGLWSKLPLGDVAAILRHFGKLELVLLFLPIPVAIGLLKIKPWGWWLFLGYAAWISIFNLYWFILNPVPYNIFSLTQTVAGLGAIGFFLKKNTYAPYLSKIPRGFRSQNRFAIVLPIEVDGVARTLRDISETGCYIHWADCTLARGDEVSLRFEFFGKRFSVRAKAARTDGSGVGVAFHGLDRETARALRKSLGKNRGRTRE